MFGTIGVNRRRHFEFEIVWANGTTAVWYVGCGAFEVVLDPDKHILGHNDGDCRGRTLKVADRPPHSWRTFGMKTRVRRWATRSENGLTRAWMKWAAAVAYRTKGGSM